MMLWLSYDIYDVIGYDIYNIISYDIYDVISYNNTFHILAA